MGSAPTNVNDGMIIVNSTVRNQYNILALNDTIQVNNEYYYYKAFPYNSDKVHNNPAR